MKFQFTLIFMLVISFESASVGANDRPRLFVLTDIGGDPDDQQSLIRLMVYCNEFQVEGLVASASGTPGELKVATTKPELIREFVSAYGNVRENLARIPKAGPKPSLFSMLSGPAIRNVDWNISAKDTTLRGQHFRSSASTRGQSTNR